jgi:hypothetical protein
LTPDAILSTKTVAADATVDTLKDHTIGVGGSTISYVNDDLSAMVNTLSLWLIVNKRQFQNNESFLLE